MNKLILSLLASAGLLSFTSCDTMEDHDSDHRHHRGSTTTTTTEETTLSRRVVGAPLSTTVETQTTRSY